MVVVVESHLFIYLTPYTNVMTIVPRLQNKWLLRAPTERKT